MRFLPQVVLATFAVAVAPVAFGWWLRADGLISSPWLCVAVAITLSVVVSALGSAYWTRRGKSADVLFSELLVWGWLRRYRLERQLATAGERLGLLPSLEPARAQTDTADSYQRLLRQLGAALEAQDPYLDGHSRRVARYATSVARQMGLRREEVARVRAAAAVHDVGKLHVPAEVLRKSGPLSDAEFEQIMRHADEGAEMVACLEDPELTGIVRHHHERFDGLGYPSGLHGEDIPLGARIVAVADTFDAITSARPYRVAARHREAIDIIVAQAGTQLDPAVVRAFLRYYSGRKAAVLWVILAVSPSRAVASMRGRAGHPATVPIGDLAASAVGRMVICAAAVGTTVGVGVARYEGQAPQTPPASQVASATPFASSLNSGTSGLGGASSAAPTGQAAQSLTPATQLAGNALLSGIRALATGTGSTHAAHGGVGTAGAYAGGRSGAGSSWILSLGAGAGTAPVNARGPGRSGAGALSGLHTGVTPVNRTGARPPHGGTPAGGSGAAPATSSISHAPAPVTASPATPAPATSGTSTPPSSAAPSPPPAHPPVSGSDSGNPSRGGSTGGTGSRGGAVHGHGDSAYGHGDSGYGDAGSGHGSGHSGRVAAPNASPGPSAPARGSVATGPAQASHGDSPADPHGNRRGRSGRF
jgi:putative nucleotidyltransferase with HDIG domain